MDCLRGFAWGGVCFDFVGGCELVCFAHSGLTVVLVYLEYLLWIGVSG